MKDFMLAVYVTVEAKTIEEAEEQVRNDIEGKAAINVFDISTRGTTHAYKLGET